MKRVLNGPAMLHAATPTAAAVQPPVQFRHVRVLLLDKREFFVKVENKNARVSQVFEETCAHLNLKETDLFGLALLRDNEYFFVHADTKLQKLSPKMWSQKEGVDEPCLTFLFKVMFYVDNVRLLKYRTTRHLYYLQLKENLLTYNLSISEEKCFLLSAYSLITDHGVYKDHLHGNNNYFRPEDYLPAWVIMRHGLDYMSHNLPVMHRDMSSEAVMRDARLIFITELSTPPCCHNFHMYRLTRKKYDETDNFSMSIGPNGLDIFEQHGGLLRLTISFPWSNLTKFNCDRKKFELVCRGSNEARLSCFARSKEWCVHHRYLCKAAQKFHQTINPLLVELNHQENIRDAVWWPEKYVPSEFQDFDRGGSSGSDNSRHHVVCSDNGQTPKRLDTDAAHPTTRVEDEELVGEIDVGDGREKMSNGVHVERKEEVFARGFEDVVVDDVDDQGVDAVMRGNEFTDEVVVNNEEIVEASTPPNVSKNSTRSSRTSHIPRKSSEDLNLADLNINDSEILIDTPPNSDSQNLTIVTPLSSNLSPFEQCLAIGSDTPKNASVYRHTSYLGTPLSPYLYNSQQQPPQQTHQVPQGHPHLTRHPMGSSGQQSLLWRASCSGRLMKRHMRSLECASTLHSTEHIPKSTTPLHSYVGHCIYKSNPLSIYNMPVYHQNSVNNILNYAQDNGSGSLMLSQEFHKNSIGENVNAADSDGSIQEETEAEMSDRPPPPPYEDAARNSKMRLSASSSRGLDFESDELVGCGDFHQPTGSNASGSYSDFNWAGSSSPKLLNQSHQPPSILDFQFPLLSSSDIGDDYCTPIINNPDIQQQQQQQQQSLEFQPSDLLPDRRFPYHRSSLNSYEQLIQQRRHHNHHLQAYQFQPQKIKAVSPFYAEQVQLSTPLMGRKNLQVFNQFNVNPQDLRVPSTKTLRKASSTESEPGEIIQKERGRGRPVQRHHSNITYLREYKNSEDSKLSFPLVSALLKDPSLQQNVRSFPSNLAALVCDNEQQQT